MSNICERIRINGKPISKNVFTSYFFEIWDKLPDRATCSLDIPRYLQLLALLSFHVFIREGVDVAIFETHLGGEFDATNIISIPIVTAVTSIAMDHVRLLGPSIENIAWHKGGIFKSGSLAFSTFQEDAVVSVLQQRANEKGVELKFVGIDSTILDAAVSLMPKMQRVNCSLALAVVRAWLSVMAPKRQGGIEDSILHGIERFFWPGRYQQINDPNCQWFLDGAHNESSLRYTAEWFAVASAEYQTCVMIKTTEYRLRI